jgi:hypothetical protein
MAMVACGVVPLTSVGLSSPDASGRGLAPPFANATVAPQPAAPPTPAPSTSVPNQTGSDAQPTLVSTSPATGGAPTPSTALQPASSSSTHRVSWGFFTDGFPGNPTAIDRIAASTGRNPNYVMWYVHWGGPWNAINLGDTRAVLARGATPIITWMSDDPTVSGDAFPLHAIAAGQFDTYVRGWATALAQAGGAVLIRFDHEMNGNWYPWSPGVGASTAADYVAAWRHVHDIFAAAGAGNVRFVWSPNVQYTGSAPLASLYPGDAYVNWTGVDGYNWGSVHPWSGWQSPRTVFDATITAVRAISQRPLMIAEVGCAPTPGDKAAWITNFFQLLSSNRSISAFVWFDVNKETDWRFNSSSAALAAFVSGLRQTAR